MNTSLIISGVAHAVFLAWCVLTFAAKPFHTVPIESLPVDVISDSEFSKITAGAKNAPQAEAAKPLVDEVGPPRPVEDPNAKLDKKTVAAATDTPPAPKPPEPKTKKPPEPKKDPIADTIQKDA